MCFLPAEIKAREKVDKLIEISAFLPKVRPDNVPQKYEGIKFRHNVNSLAHFISFPYTIQFLLSSYMFQIFKKLSRLKAITGTITNGIT